MPDQKPTNRERLREITEGIESGIRDLFESDKYRQYLSVMSRFPRYSLNNTMLIYMQKPDATLVAGYERWKKQFGRYVRRGERGITIIAPTSFKKKIQEQKLDPDTKAPVLDKNGNIVMEEKEIEIPTYRPVKVFDVSQTDGNPLPSLVDSLSGTVKNYEAFLEALCRSSPVPVSMEPMSAKMDGYFSRDQQRIAVREGMSEVQTISAVIHEIAHSKLHNYEKAAEGEGKEKDRRTEEVEAESISYAVCQYYGIETGGNSFGYIASWSQGKELPELRASLEIINKTAGSLIQDIDRNFRAICQERGIDFSKETKAGERENARAEPEHDPNLVKMADEYASYGIDVEWRTGEEFPLSVPELEKSRSASSRQPRRYAMDENGEIRRTWNGKFPEEFGEQDTHDFMKETEQVLQGTDETGRGNPEPVSGQLPDTREQTLDEYPVPDENITRDALEACGYMDEDLLPLSKERAAELYEKDLTIYAVVDGGNAQMLFDRKEFEEQLPETVYAISRKEWENSPEFDSLIQERLNHQEEREQAFLSYAEDCFAIYQMKDEDGLHGIRFQGLDRLQHKGIAVERANYDLVYTAPLADGTDVNQALEQLYTRFNIDHPVDYHSPSMSVSDIVAIRMDGALSCHYCDSFQFTPIQGFLLENPLKTAELTLEDDYGMIDGMLNNGTKDPTVKDLEQQVKNVQSISLMELVGAVRREERKKKPSVIQKLKEWTGHKRNKTAPKRDMEREI